MGIEFKDSVKPGLTSAASATSIPTSSATAEGSGEGASSGGDLGAWAASLALKGIEKVKDGLRAVDALSRKGVVKSAAEVERLRAINLAAVKVWETYNKEGEKAENDNATGVLGHAVGFVDYLIRDDGKTIADDRVEKWALERELVAEIKKTIATGEADTLREALNLIRSYGPASLREPAKRFLEEKVEFGHRKGYPLWELVDFSSRPDKDSATAHDLIERAFELEYDNDAVETPFAVYSLVHAVSEDSKVRERAEEGMKALSGESGFGRAALKFVFSSSPEGAAIDVGLMFASAGLGNLAKLSALTKLEKAGVTGYKAVALGKAAEIGTEATALWALNAGREVLTHDVSKALDPAHLAKSLAATGLMIGFLKVFGAAGGELAKRLGLVPKVAAEAAKLPFWKKAAGFAIGHGSGLAGMVTSTKAGGALDLHDAPAGGANESLVHDLFGYVKFALAHKAVDRLLGGKLSEIGHRLHAKTVVVEAKIKVHEAIDDLLATSPRVPDAAREAIRNGLLAEAMRTGRILTRVDDVLPRILEALKVPGSRKPTVVEDSRSGVTIELRDEEIRTSDTEPLPAAARRAVAIPPVFRPAEAAPRERPISLGAHRKEVSPSSGTFHAARIRLETIHRKIARGAMDPTDSAVLKEIEKCEALLEKYRTLRTTVADAAPKSHARLLIKKSAEPTVLAVGGEAVIYDHKDGRVLKVAKVKKSIGPDGRVITWDPASRLDLEQEALEIVARLAAENSALSDFTPTVMGRPAPDRLEMSKLPGESLARLSKTAPERLIAIPEAAWAQFLKNLKFLNERGLTHGDVNPENILWDGEKLRMVDFGSAKLRTKVYTDFKGDRVFLDVRRAEIVRGDLSKKDFKGFPLRVPPKISAVAITSFSTEQSAQPF